MAHTPGRLEQLRDDLQSLTGDENAFVRSAIRIALNELDLAALSTDPEPHYCQVARILNEVARILNAVLHPDSEAR